MIWDCTMLRDELDMLECRLTEMQDYDVTHVLVEAAVTHLGIPKPLYFQENQERFKPWKDRIRHVVAPVQSLHTLSVSRTGEPLPWAMADPWQREHAQRDAARQALDPEPGDLVLICDVDEIPSHAALSWDGTGAAALQMRTCIYAVDWESPGCPPASVIAGGDCLKGRSLAAVRDARASYPVISDGGWHLSWLGGPDRQREKLETASCHATEIDATPEGALIRSGERYRFGADGGGLPVVPVDVNETWPRYVYERRCPANWFRPRDNA